jgi:hypothetical protein
MPEGRCKCNASDESKLLQFYYFILSILKQSNGERKPICVIIFILLIARGLCCIIPGDKASRAL